MVTYLDIMNTINGTAWIPESTTMASCDERTSTKSQDGKIPTNSYTGNDSRSAISCIDVAVAKLLGTLPTSDELHKKLSC